MDLDVGGWRCECKRECENVPAGVEGSALNSVLTPPGRRGDAPIRV